MNRLFSAILLASLSLTTFPVITHADAVTQPKRPCGPSMTMYRVSSPNHTSTDGIRCVKWGAGYEKDARVPVFAWYGEGRWEGAEYRHLGQAYRKAGSKDMLLLQGFASDFIGNGEMTEGNYPGNLEIKILDTNMIHVGGVWNETWTYADKIDRTPLGPIKTCGKWFDEYQAMSMDEYAQSPQKPAPSKGHEGVRCVLRVGPRGTTWYGVGAWDGKTYSHLATGSSKGYGSSDFCATGEGFCGNVTYGGIRRRISTKWKRPVIDGWNEVWIRR